MMIPQMTLTSTPDLVLVAGGVRVKPYQNPSHREAFDAPILQPILQPRH